MNVIIAVDTSYSMSGYISKVVDGLNNFLEKLKILSIKNRQTVYLSVVSFNTNVSYVIKSVNVTMIDKFYTFQFNSFGMTSLYDAIGQVLFEFGTISQYPSYFFIISDGEDNSSKNFNKETTDEILTISQKNNWKITHCHTDTNILNIPTVTYDIEDIDNLFNNLCI